MENKDIKELAKMLKKELGESKSKGLASLLGESLSESREFGESRKRTYKPNTSSNESRYLSGESRESIYKPTKKTPNDSYSFGESRKENNTESRW